MTRQSEWRAFVEQRRAELHDAYPCAMPTQRRRCSRHDVPIPQTKRIPEAWVELPDGSWRHVDKQTLHLSAICKPRRDELYQQLAGEYTRGGGSMTTNTDQPPRARSSTNIRASSSCPARSTLFRTSDPKVALQRMSEIAKEIADVIDSQKLLVRISGKKYVTCPGWKTVGGMHGLSPYTVWTRPNEAG